MNVTEDRVCLGCGTTKPLTDYYKGKGRGGYRTRCKPCLNGQSKAWAGANKDRHKALKDAWRAANADHVKADAAAYRASHRDRRRTYGAAYYQVNKDRYRANWQAYKAKKLGATVGWVDPHILRHLYKLCYLCNVQNEAEVHMDHVVPLSRGGAHSMDNLRPTHPGCNLRKSDLLLSELDWYSGPLIGRAHRQLEGR